VSGRVRQGGTVSGDPARYPNHAPMLARAAVVSIHAATLGASAFCQSCGRRLVDGRCEHGKATLSGLFQADGTIGGVTIA